jgi:transposase-like protein
MRNKLKTIFKKTNKENEEQTNNQITRLYPKNDNEKRNKRITEMLAEYCQKYPQI